MKEILVVDDDPDLVFVQTELLEKNGYSVTAALSGKQALWLVEQHCFDVVISDIVMPEMDGMELIRQIHTKSPGIKIIAMSGGGRVGTTENYLANALKIGAVAVIEKPVAAEKLLSVLGDILRQAQE